MQHEEEESQPVHLFEDPPIKKSKYWGSIDESHSDFQYLNSQSYDYEVDGMIEKTTTKQQENNSQDFSAEAIDPDGQVKEHKDQLKIDCTEKKKKGKKDYDKNICGYAVKSAAKEMMTQSYRRKNLELCRNEDMEEDQLMSWLKKIQKKNVGLTHLKSIIERKGEKEEDIKCSDIFLRFLGWFLREKYLKLMLVEGKMDQKKQYIKSKNKILYLLPEDSEFSAWNELTN